MINIRFYKFSYYITVIKLYQSLYYISTQFPSTIPKTYAVRYNSNSRYLVHNVKMLIIHHRISGAPAYKAGPVALLPAADT